MVRLAIKKQVNLSLGRAAGIAWRSLRVRGGRSLLTAVTIAMAIAFLTNVWTTRVVTGQIATATAVVAGSTDGTPPPLPGPAPAPPGGTVRTAWLLSLSLLTCLVGISNAMLMSVMERFREIGTMKCLGALDGFILKLFFLESLMLGAAGSAVGALFGAGLTAVLLWHRVAEMGHALPWGLLWGIAAASLGIGVAITAVAALYPAWKAARMQPIAAMRVEA